MQRHTITLGATTTSGGKVVSASANGTIEGCAIAVEGDRIICPVCKSEGKIVCVGPRNQESWNGKAVALEDDFCHCKCQVLPKLIPSQKVRYQKFSGDYAQSQNSVSDSQSSRNELSKQRIIEQSFALVGENDTPVNDFHHDLIHAGKIHSKAAAFKNGVTATVEGDGPIELVAWLPVGNSHA
ncbi:PAAR domain-containing protein [Duganella qianjiadongensis]|uniref:PAAR domain-containing protein n=1 Tax=Duganella qianjiadongensis TaxID=2692176 RepID=A0ABW9VKP9_9BURK|nr:PAAR domain-containing protein [Duganella qianjiadongensis]MYM39942.1 hypothetical protein [Duganella qianjiadongensis]